MNRSEWAQISAYLSAGVGKPIPANQLEVYFELLADLPAAAVAAAARQALAESQYPVVPPVGVLRQLAARATAPREILWGEAWELVVEAVRRWGLDQERRALESLPPPVARAARAVGWRSLCDCPCSGAETLRAQFRDVYVPMAERERREHALPAPLRETLRQLGGSVCKALPAPAGAGGGDA